MKKQKVERVNYYVYPDTRQSLIDIGMKAGAKEGRAASLGLRISAAYHERLIEALRKLADPGCDDMGKTDEDAECARALLTEIEEAGK